MKKHSRTKLIHEGRYLAVLRQTNNSFQLGYSQVSIVAR
jgi:hypothetical protein